MLGLIVLSNSYVKHKKNKKIRPRPTFPAPVAVLFPGAFSAHHRFISRKTNCKHSPLRASSFDVTRHIQLNLSVKVEFGKHINVKGIIGIVLFIVTPFSIFKVPNTKQHILTDLLAALWCIFVGVLLWFGWDR
jgi:hypothetical protein